MFIKREKHPSPPFTRNYLTHKTLNKKVKGEGLKTLFYIYARQGKKSVFSFFWLSGFSKNPKKEYNIRFKIYPSPRHHNTYPSSYSQHLFSWLILRRYSAIFRRYFRILRRYSAIFRSNFRVNEFRNSYRLTSGRANPLSPTTNQPNEYQNKKQRIKLI